MGVDIGPLFKKEEIAIKDLQHRVIAIDAHNVLHQFLSSIRQRDGALLKDSKGKTTSHLSGLLQRTGTMIEKKLKPVFVFDGKADPLKQKTIKLRHQRKILAEKEWKEALEKGDLETARSKAQQTSIVNKEIVNQSIELLESLGVPYVKAPSEGEAQASHMVLKGNAYAAGSQDYDCLLVGTPILVRNLTLSSKRKLPGKKAYVPVHPERINLKNNLKGLGINHKQLVDMAILIGTDFNEGVKGIGPKKSLSLIKKNGNVENALSTFGGEGAPTFDEIKEIRELFLKPKVTDDYHLEWVSPDVDKVLNILCDKHQFSEDRVKSVLGKFSSLEEMVKQQTLF